MAVLNFLSRIYGIFFLTASIAMVRLSYKEIQKLNPSEPLKREREKSSGIKSKGWENRVYTVLLFSTIAVLFVGACFLLIFLREYMWVGIVISIPVGIMFVAGILYSTDILGVIIKNDDGGSHVSRPNGDGYGRGKPDEGDRLRRHEKRRNNGGHYAARGGIKGAAKRWRNGTVSQDQPTDEPRGIGCAEHGKNGERLAGVGHGPDVG